MENVKLENMFNGGVQEQFDVALKEVIENIMDINKDDSVREINIKIKMKPDRTDRRNVSYAVATTTKLSPDNSIISKMYVGKHDGELKAYEDDITQIPLFEDSEGAPNVEHIKFNENRG